MGRAKQSPLDRARRLSEGQCPIHGLRPPLRHLLRLGPDVAEVDRGSGCSEALRLHRPQHRREHRSRSGVPAAPPSLRVLTSLGDYGSAGRQIPPITIARRRTRRVQRFAKGLRRQLAMQTKRIRWTWLPLLLHLGIVWFSFSSRASAQPSACELVWEDEFDGAGVNPANWEMMLGDGTLYELPPGWGNNELQYYTDRPENVFVADGLLHIVAHEEEFEGYQYTSARLRSKNLRDFLYGRMEARINLPTGQGMWPAFWMLPTDEVYGGWAASGEIDIMEAANIPTTIHGTIHYGGSWPNNVYSGGTYFDGTNYSEDFHVYAIEWELDEIRWYVDGLLYHVETSQTWYSAGVCDNPQAPFDHAFHFLLNVAVGGNFPGLPDASTVFPQEMLVDWVRVTAGPPFDCDACPTDLNGNGSVDVPDLLALLAAWGTNPGGPPDFDGDGMVAVPDLLALLAAWGPCP